MYVEAERMLLCVFDEDHPNVQRVHKRLATCRAAMASPDT